MRRLIVFLVRLRFGLAKYEKFIFTNQHTTNVYYFTEIGVMKQELRNGHWVTRPSSVSLNWLLDPDCGVLPFHGELKCLNRKGDENENVEIHS